MLKRNIELNFIWFLLLFLFQLNTLSAQTSTLRGTVVDSTTNQILPGANILLLGTHIGTASDTKGKFIIRNIPPGKYKIRTSYIGYKENELVLNFSTGRVIETVIKLNSASLEGETVTVIGQSNSQIEAISKQLSSDQIKNVVSLERIQKLADVNAADVAARFPGVSLIRDGGEGAELVIRGLAPQYNQITIDGIQLPRTLL
ncbi:MAG: carboxypeptidase-like regulatory domain-containing protein [Ignavibacteriales bacterium]|nr:carboxypeptidase-like regulatory domain-containing protein [Ignavibacteriales bacterium]